MTSRPQPTIFVVLFLLATIPNASPSDVETLQLHSIDISMNDGVIFVETINITGQSTIPAAELVWSITPIESFSQQNPNSEQLMSSSIFNSVVMNNDIYDWQLTLPVNGLNCTCVFSIESINDEHIHDNLVMFIGINTHFPVIKYMPSFQEYESNVAKIFEFKVIFPEESLPNSFELLNTHSFRASICQYSGNSCITESTLVELNHTLNDAGTFNVEIDKTHLELADGNWNLKIFLRDSFLRLSNHVEMVLTFDTSPPEVNILGAESSVEMNYELYSANVDDGYDNSLIAITWTITEPSGLTRGILQSEMVTDTSVGIEFNQSGDWNISVLAIDSAGYFTKESVIITVANIPPQINFHASVSSNQVNTELVYDSSDSWFIDASLSSDTVNDLNGLKFNWIHDGEIIHDGPNITHLDYDKLGSSILILQVSDSDGATSEYSFQIELTNSENTNSKENIFIGVFTIIIVLLLSVFLLKRSRVNEPRFNLPKWDK
ncbi:MAG: hypothetical protein VXZ47_05710 [Candidatus Thermoplasmatota archaeon]|nr:hypothetical protein [Candidatus Thermoplasmatota archaeon]